MKKEKPPPKADDEYAAFKNLLNKIAKVPKAEADKKEEDYKHCRASRK